MTVAQAIVTVNRENICHKITSMSCGGLINIVFYKHWYMYLYCNNMKLHTWQWQASKLVPVTSHWWVKLTSLYGKYHDILWFRKYFYCIIYSLQTFTLEKSICLTCQNPASECLLMSYSATFMQTVKLIQTKCNTCISDSLIPPTSISTFMWKIVKNFYLKMRL